MIIIDKINIYVCKSVTSIICNNGIEYFNQQNSS